MNMEELDNTMIGRGRDAIDMIIDKDSFQENIIDGYSFDPDYGPGSVVGTAKLNGKPTTIIANDAMAFNDRFPVVFGGVIGLEEGYKMATAVYRTMEADKDKPLPEKRAIVLIVDTPGNGPGKMEEIAGMNKSTGGYQLALAEARKAGHPIVAMVIGRAISGAFLCHGLMNYGIKPDIVSMAKALGGGMPIGAICATAEVAKAFTPGSHGTTFGGHPVCCAAALAEVNELLDRDLAGNAAKIGAYFMEQLKTLPHVKEVRGQGLLVGVEFDDTISGVDVKHECLHRHLLITAIGAHIIRMIPPLIINKEDCDKAVAIIREAVEALERV